MQRGNHNRCTALERSVINHLELTPLSKRRLVGCFEVCIQHQYVLLGVKMFQNISAFEYAPGICTSHIPINTYYTVSSCNAGTAVVTPDMGVFSHLIAVILEGRVEKVICF